MSKPFTCIAIVLLSLVALLQLARFVFRWPVLINGFAVPLWFSLLAFVVLVVLAVFVHHESRA